MEQETKNFFPSKVFPVLRCLEATPTLGKKKELGERPTCAYAWCIIHSASVSSHRLGAGGGETGLVAKDLGKGSRWRRHSSRHLVKHLPCRLLIPLPTLSPSPVNVTGEGRKPPALRPSINPSQPLSFLSAVSTFTFRRRTSVSRGIYFTTVGQTVYPSVYLRGIYSIFYRLDWKERAESWVNLELILIFLPSL